jgi:uncharacterized membrane protein
VITHSIEINRRPEDVFAYIDQLDRHGEWQADIVKTQVQTEGPTRVGTRAVDTRMIGRREQDVPYEIVEHDPPHRSAFRGVAGPIRPAGTVIIDSLDDGARARVTIEFDLRGHGIGVLLAPLARRQAAKAIGAGHAKLKENLERGA